MVENPIVLAVVAHPDDIEFMIAGTLIHLRDAGAEIHTWNMLNGCCGSLEHSKEEIIAMRWAEAQEAAQSIGATAHAPLFDDLGVFYDAPSLAKVAAVIRSIQPDIILTHSPQDYMEDHQNVCRLTVSAAFSRGMPNYTPDPATPPYDKQVAVYHALPHGLQDGLREYVTPHFTVDIEPVLELKTQMLACHRSQQAWLSSSQGMNAYLQEMHLMAADVARLYSPFKYAEGWRQHSHLGFCARSYQPLQTMLRPFMELCSV